MEDQLFKKFGDQFIWSLKYRPQTIEDIVIPNRISSLLKKIRSSGSMQNMILYGPPGTSKTTGALVIARELEYSPLYINASDETSVDVIRTKIKQFVTSKSMISSNKKLVILDEAEQVSTQFWAAFRSFIEEFSKNANFIVITNYLSKVPDPIISRFTAIDYHFTAEENKQVKIGFFKEVLKILEKEEVEYNKKVVAHVIETYFTDMRKILNELQRLASENALNDLSVIKKLTVNTSDFFKYIEEKDFSAMQKYIANISDYSTFFSKMYDEGKKYIANKSILEYYVMLGEYHNRAANCVDQRINTCAMACEMMTQIELKE